MSFKLKKNHSDHFWPIILLCRQSGAPEWNWPCGDGTGEEPKVAESPFANVLILWVWWTIKYQEKVQTVDLDLEHIEIYPLPRLRLQIPWRSEGLLFFYSMPNGSNCTPKNRCLLFGAAHAIRLDSLVFLQLLSSPHYRRRRMLPTRRWGLTCGKGLKKSGWCMCRGLTACPCPYMLSQGPCEVEHQEGQSTSCAGTSHACPILQC